jgi:hypothetical protein
MVPESLASCIEIGRHNPFREAEHATERCGLGQLYAHRRITPVCHLSARGRVRVRGAARHRMSATIPLMLRGSHFLCFAKERRLRRLARSCDAQKKNGTKKLATLRQFFVLIALVFPLLGANQRGPFGPMFGRVAMSITRFRKLVSCHV